MNEICAVRPNHLTEGEVEDEKKSGRFNSSSDNIIQEISRRHHPKQLRLLF